MSPAIIWLVAGMALIALETSLIPSMGFLLFSGLSALCVGLLAYFGLADTLAVQAAWWCLFSVLWAVVLWHPLKKFRIGKNANNYSDIIGSTATVNSANLRKDREGQIKWSGSIMQARLSSSASLEEIPQGMEVEIMEIQGNVALVKPR